MSSSNNNTLEDPVTKFNNKLKKNINSIFFSGDISLLITIFLFFTVISVGGVFMFEVGLDNMRTQFINNIVAVVASIGFIILIFKFMDSKINILGKEFDTGLVLYIFIGFGLLLLFSG